LDENQIISFCKKSSELGIRNIVVSGVFSPCNPDQEKQAAEIVCKNLPNATITLASDVAKLGLLERENSAILNASLLRLAQKTIQSFKNGLAKLQLNCPLFLTQNDGTLISSDMATRFPVFTIGSGTTNSIRGAAFLSKVKNAIVVDIGGYDLYFTLIFTRIALLLILEFLFLVFLGFHPQLYPLLVSEPISKYQTRKKENHYI
jgi:N-methylhydantoinase A/oxoprolinase/acetone carboxylase beta subunit